MQVRKKLGSEWVDPDDAPLLTEAMLVQAEIFEGDRFVGRGRGRPKLAAPKEPVQLRLDADVLARLRASGPGWQTRVNEILRTALGLNGLAE
ncbi:MAG TPA: BrnA antitoxin family protein [Acidocella sp.]|nr:BrnA antitoxin family protein [Acidocella sp.]OYY04789.1 MAG: hypothetical protein B7Y73_03280 [Acidocella sp. 35-58-6]HQT40252.1 BrnA antitoxin family protein [Acidocella sp.]